MELILFCWIAMAVLCAVIASSKNRSVFGWLVAGALFGIFALVAICAVPKLEPREWDSRLANSRLARELRGDTKLDMDWDDAIDMNEFLDGR